MVIVELIILLVVLLLASTIINHYLPMIPGSLIQIGLGILLSLMTNFHVNLQTNWFLLLFIAPLLFNDGKRFPKRELWELKLPIFLNAIGLVFITMIVGGLIMNLMIPEMPMAVCLALAAILSPTDPVAVQSVAERSNLPKGILHLVSGESLINDASGLIGFKYAVAAAVTGQFLWFNAVGDFFYISIVGLITGVLTMYLFLRGRNYLYQQGLQNIVFYTVAHLIAPFSIYFIAEDILHASGVIAVVGAGIVMNLMDHRATFSNPELTLVTEKSWNIIIYLLNGIIFLLLGFLLPKAMGESIQTIHLDTLEPILYSVLTWLLLLAIRILWVAGYQFVANRWRFNKINWRVATLSGLSGVRGAITMVGVLSIPFVTKTGMAFPERAMVMFIAASVIILSLLAAVLLIPLLTGQSGCQDDLNQISEDRAQVLMFQSAIQTIQRHQTEANQSAAFDLIWHYQMMLRNLSRTIHSTYYNDFNFDNELALRRIALEGERKAARQMFEEGTLPKDTYGTIVGVINQRENDMFKSLGIRNYKSTLLVDLNRFLSGMKHFLANSRKLKRDQSNLKQRWPEVNARLSQAAIDEVKAYLARPDIDQSVFSQAVVDHIIIFYRNRAHRDNQLTDEYQLEYHRLLVLAFEAQRGTIDRLATSRQIDWRLANQLRQHVNYLENILMNQSEIEQ